MRALSLASLAAFGALIFASPAAAAIVTAAVSGNYDDVAPHGFWSVDATYDTSRLTFSQQILAGGIVSNDYTWNAASGDPSPIISGVAVATGETGFGAGRQPAITWDLALATSFGVTIDQDEYSLGIAGPGWALDVGEFNFGTALFQSGGLPSLEDSFTSGWTGEYGVVRPPGRQGDLAAAIFMKVGVPEPQTWTMMLLGFLGVGGLLRSRRSPQLPASAAR